MISTPYSPHKPAYAAAAPLPTAAPQPAPLNYDIPAAGSFNIHTMHWSTILLGAAALVAAIVAIGGLVISSTPLAAAAGFYFAVTAIGAYYTHTFSEYKSLESYNLMLRQQIDSLSANSGLIQIQTENLAKASQELSDLNEEKAKYEIRHKKEIIEQEQRFKKEISQLSSINDNLKSQFEDSQKEAESRLSKLLLVNGSLTRAVEQDRKNIESLEISLSQLNSEINRLTQENAEQEHNLLDYDAKNKEYDSLNKELQTQIEGFKQASLSTLSTESFSNLFASTKELAETVKSATSETEAKENEIKAKKEQVEAKKKRIKDLLAKKEKLNQIK